MVVQWLQAAAAVAATIVEVFAILIVLSGAVQAGVGVIASVIRPAPNARLAVWRQFARWIVLGLEFELAADIIRTVIAPSWSDIGQLAAIAAIRTAA